MFRLFVSEIAPAFLGRNAASTSILLVLATIIGCGGGEKNASPDAQAQAEIAQIESTGQTVAEESSTVSPSDSGTIRRSAPKPLAATSAGTDQQEFAFNPKVDSDALSNALFGETTEGQAEPVTKPATAPARSDRLQLQTELPVPRLVDFLRAVDIEMQNVALGRTKIQDHVEANEELTRLATLKLQASDRLIEQAEQDSEQQVMGLRGKLQSLSHLAALGDLPSAEQLEKVAKEQATSKIASLAMDSKLVLVGLAMERLRNGASKSSGEILDLISSIAKGPQTPDVSALMVMGQAHAVLQQYGDEAAAEKVRETIIDLFADHPNENVAAMAIGLAGSPKFAEIDQILRGFGRGEQVDLNRWRDVVEKLLETSADVTTIQYLAGAALQFEAAGNNQLSDATFEVIAESENVAGKSAEELAVAVQARQARRSAIGETFAFDGPSVDGRPLSIESFAGQVVLMPFWAISIPESLSVLQTLDQIRQAYDGKVEIVGMNLDAEDAPAAEFLLQSPVPFRSFQSATSAAGANEIARQFGVVSLPYVVILDASGKVAAIDLSGRGLREQVAKVIGQ